MCSTELKEAVGQHQQMPVRIVFCMWPDPFYPSSGGSLAPTRPHFCLRGAAVALTTPATRPVTYVLAWCFCLVEKHSNRSIGSAHDKNDVIGSISGSRSLYVL